MSLRAAVIASMVLAATLAGAIRADEPPDLPAEELARRGTEATAIVRGPTELLATAFCVHPSGLFVTTAAALVHPAAGEFAPTVQLTLRPGKSDQAVHIAQVLRCLWDPGLALLKVDGAVHLKVLALAPSESVEELLDIAAFDIPARATTDPKTQRELLRVHVATGSISAIQREKTQLRRIQFDAPLSTGSTGGLLLDKKARVVGVILGRARANFGAGVDLAIPVNMLDEFVSRVDLTFDAPVLSKRNLLRPMDFEVRVWEPFPSRDPLALELTLDGLGSGAPRRTPMTLARVQPARRMEVRKQRSGAARRMPMTLTGQSSFYAARAAPAVAALAPATVWLEATYKDGSLLGQVEDRTIEITGARTVWLGELRHLRPGPRAVAQLGDGRTLRGAGVSGLGETTMTVHGQNLKVDLGRAEEIAVKGPESFPGLACTFVARRAGREVGRLEAVIYDEDRVRPCLEALRADRFIRPPRSATPVTHLALAIGPVLPERPLDFEEGEFQLNLRVPHDFTRFDPATGGPEAVERSKFKRGVAITFPQHQHWELVFEAPHFQEFEAGVYTVRPEQDLLGTSPQIKLATDLYWDPKVSGRFVMWEMEVKEGAITRLAFDFTGRGTGAFKNRQDFSGIVRYHSNFR
jgi:hypothetical protein